MQGFLDSASCPSAVLMESPSVTGRPFSKELCAWVCGGGLRPLGFPTARALKPLLF